MKLIKRLFTALLATGLMAEAAHADPFTVLNPAQPTASKDKIEVIEFFSYHCPHCYHLDPTISAWAAKLPKDVEFKRVHIMWPGMSNIQPYTKLFHTMQALGVQDKLHGKLFDAVHRDKIEVRKLDIAEDWFAKQGVDKARFDQAFNSFGVATATNQAEAVTKAYRVDGVPTVVVNGKYKTSVSDAGGEPQLLTLLDQLIDKERQAMPKPAADKKADKKAKK